MDPETEILIKGNENLRSMFTVNSVGQFVTNLQTQEVAKLMGLSSIVPNSIPTKIESSIYHERVVLTDNVAIAGGSTAISVEDATILPNGSQSPAITAWGYEGMGNPTPLSITSVSHSAKTITVSAVYAALAKGTDILIARPLMPKYTVLFVGETANSKWYAGPHEHGAPPGNRPEVAYGPYTYVGNTSNDPVGWEQGVGITGGPFIGDPLSYAKLKVAS